MELYAGVSFEILRSKHASLVILQSTAFDLTGFGLPSWVVDSSLGPTSSHSFVNRLHQDNLFIANGQSSFSTAWDKTRLSRSA